jgi:hypothetical protein
MESYRIEQLARRLRIARKSVVQRLHARSNRAHQRVAFVAGVQRSGTNMMMDVLERSDETDVYHEHDPRAFDNYQMRDLTVIRRLLQRSVAPCFVIKSLCELPELGSLMEEFRPAKTVWLTRHYDDVVNSMLVSFRNQANQVKRIARNRTSDGWLSRGLSDDTYAHLQDLVHPDISDASAAALIWYFRSVLYFEQGFDQDPRVTLVRYESLVAEPQREFARVFAFLGLNYSAYVSRKVFGNSVNRRLPLDIEAPIRELCDGLMLRFEAVAREQHNA